MLDKLLVQGRRPPFPTLARSASRMQNVRCIRDDRSTRVSRADLMARPEGLESPTTWFEASEFGRRTTKIGHNQPFAS